jgi:hypothetical protein
VQVILLHREVNDAKAWARAGCAREGSAQRWEHVLTAQRLELAAEYDVHRVARELPLADAMSNETPACAQLSLCASLFLCSQFEREIELDWSLDATALTPCHLSKA